MYSRKIIHIDMDAFYASVEVLNNPSFKGRPVIVGGNPNCRSVVCSASYEARKFGVKSAMACSIAKRLCPDAVFLRPNFPKYKEVSANIHEVFHRFTNKIERLALDEAWLDVTENRQNIPSATWIAKKIKDVIRKELRLSCSAGISFNKFLAKIASDEDKPNGLFVITPDDAHQFLNKMEIWKVPGVGKVTQRKLEALGIRFGYQLYAKPEGFLIKYFGKMGSYLYNIIRGIDLRPVCMQRERKSISAENTFEVDLLYGDCLLKEMRKIVYELITRLEKSSMFGKTLTLKVKFGDFRQITRNITRNEPFFTYEDSFHFGEKMLKKVCHSEFRNKPIRLIGVGFSNFISGNRARRINKQLDFFHLLK